MSPSKGDAGFITLRANRGSGGASHELHVVVKRRNASISMDSRITVLDGWEESKGEGFGELRLLLPGGLYTVKVERGGAVQEEIIRHAAARSLEIPEPRRPSAVPTFDTVDSHEYYSYTAHEQSRKDTDQAAPVFNPAHPTQMRSGRLFIFVRAESEERYQGEDLAESLFLYDAAGARLTDFGPAAAFQDRKHGWMALSVAAPPGSYRLHFSGLRPREMILPVFTDWETQVFVPFEQRPRLAQTSILLARRGNGFSPDDRTAQVVDAALKGLQSGISVLPPSDREMLLYGKFENPLLGLIGAHLLLMQRRSKLEQLDFILQNLEMLLPGSADVRALRVAASVRRKQQLPAVSLAEPPMLRRGLDVLLEASAIAPDLVIEGGLIERIAPYLLADSPWTTWSLPTMVEGTRLEDPLAAVKQLATAEVEQFAKGALSSMPRDEVSRALQSALPRVLERVGEKAQRGLQRGLDELASPVTERMLETARGVSESAVRQSVNQAVLNSVDAALRAETEPASLSGSADELPLWVRNIVEDARNSKAGLNIESIARQTRLPVRLLRRLLK